MRRRDLVIGPLLAGAAQSIRAQEGAKHRIAIVISTGPATGIHDKGIRLWQGFWQELRRLGDVEGQSLTVERYSGEGRPEGFADLAREVVSRNPDVIVAVAGPITLAVDAATSTIPIVGSGAYTELGQVPSLAHPAGNITGVTVTGYEIYGKRLQILKEALPVGMQGCASGHAHRCRRTTASGSASRSEPTVGNLADRHCAPGVDAFRVSARIR